MTKLIPQEVFVVEGRNDTRHLQEVFGPSIKTIETNGSAISSATLQRIAEAAKIQGVIVLTDPDYQGERIRRRIQEQVPDVKHVYLQARQAQGQRAHQNLGVEYTAAEDLRRALENVWTPRTEEVREISLKQLMDLKLVAHPQAAQKRQQVAEAFHLGPLNARQLRKQLANYGISYEGLLQVLQESEVNE